VNHVWLERLDRALHRRDRRPEGRTLTVKQVDAIVLDAACSNPVLIRRPVAQLARSRRDDERHPVPLTLGVEQVGDDTSCPAP